jgi:hypothetical protein
MNDGKDFPANEQKVGQFVKNKQFFQLTMCCKTILLTVLRSVKLSTFEFSIQALFPRRNIFVVFEKENVVVTSRDTVKNETIVFDLTTRVRCKLQ